MSGTKERVGDEKLTIISMTVSVCISSLIFICICSIIQTCTVVSVTFRYDEPYCCSSSGVQRANAGSATSSAYVGC